MFFQIYRSFIMHIEIIFNLIVKNNKVNTEQLFKKNILIYASTNRLF